MELDILGLAFTFLFVDLKLDALVTYSSYTPTTNKQIAGVFINCHLEHEYSIPYHSLYAPLTR